MSLQILFRIGQVHTDLNKVITDEFPPNFSLTVSGKAVQVVFFFSIDSVIVFNNRNFYLASCCCAQQQTWNGPKKASKAHGCYTMLQTFTCSNKHCSAQVHN